MKRSSLFIFLFLMTLPFRNGWAQIDDPIDFVKKSNWLTVEDYTGPDGSGDQGGFMLAKFRNTSQHAQLSQYRIWRELAVNITADSTGKITTLAAPQAVWVPWAVVGAVPVHDGAGPPITRVVIPTIDNVATRWAITAEMGNKSSETAVFNTESVKETLALLGIHSAMSAEEIIKIFGPSYEYVRAVLGDQKGLLLATLDLDGLRRVAMRESEDILPSDAILGITLSKKGKIIPVASGAIDNIPPAAVSDEKGGAVTEKREILLSWTTSKDDQIVGFVGYRGYAVPIPGVRSYDVFRGADLGSLQKIASLSAGSTTFKDVVPADLGNKLIYRIDATDLNNYTTGGFIPVVFGQPLSSRVSERIRYFSANGRSVFLILNPAQAFTPFVADFEDFSAFTDAFDSKPGDLNFNPQADIDDDGDVDLDDFFVFTAGLGREAVPPGSEKPVAGLK